MLIGDKFLLFNDKEYRIRSIEIGEDDFVESENQVIGQKDDVLVQRLQESTNQFLAYDLKLKVFKIFRSNGSNRLIEDIKIIQFDCS